MNIKEKIVSHIKELVRSEQITSFDRTPTEKDLIAKREDESNLNA